MEHNSVLILLASCCLFAFADNSIMDLINAQKVEQFLLERQLNSSREPPTAITLDSLHGENDNFDEGDFADINTNSIVKQNKKVKHNFPDFSTVIAAMSRTDKFLKADPTTLSVTKKEYLRKDWCKTEPILQRIREEGCIPKNVANRFCFGQCSSFYIPKNLAPRRGKKRRFPENEENAVFRSCGVCKPKKVIWVHVSLHCPGQNPPMRRRRVQKIKQCHCIADSNTF